MGNSASGSIADQSNSIGGLMHLDNSNTNASTSASNGGTCVDMLKITPSIVIGKVVSNPNSNIRPEGH